jgi:hypothetical protein
MEKGIPMEKPQGGGFIFRPTITLKDGRVLYAKHYGKKAFPIKVKDPKPLDGDPSLKQD